MKGIKKGKTLEARRLAHRKHPLGTCFFTGTDITGISQDKDASLLCPPTSPSIRVTHFSSNQTSRRHCEGKLNILTQPKTLGQDLNQQVKDYWAFRVKRKCVIYNSLSWYMQIIYTVSDIEWATNTCLPLLSFISKNLKYKILNWLAQGHATVSGRAETDTWVLFGG